MIKHTHNRSKKGRGPAGFLLFFCLTVTIAACSTKTRELFFDIPPPSPQELAEQARLKAELEAAENAQTESEESSGLGLYDYNLPRPEIESLSSWEKALDMLPKDYKDDADWSAAITQGIVRPRPGDDPKAMLATAFKYDFIIANDNPKNEGYFPHSSHTQWLGCKNCHTRIYPFRRNPATMKEMRSGESCGVCHGSVAFSLKQCKRCHLNR